MIDAGATGAIGKRLVPQLLEAGHQVTGTTRSPQKLEQLQGLGAKAVVMEGLDRSAVMAAVGGAQPDVVVHELTSLTGISANLRKIDEQFAATNALRTCGLDYLMEAARAAGARRVLAQSFSGWPNIREGGPVKTEEDPLDPHPPAKIWKIYQAIRYLEDTVTGATGVEGLVLRYGFFYGPGTSFEEGGQFVAMVRKRLFPIVGNGARVWSFSTSRTRPRPRWRPWSGANRGSTTWWTTNPRRCRCGCRTSPRSWVPSPLRVPVWLGRLVGGEVGVSIMTGIRGSSNAKAERELGWQPRFPSWREGLRRALRRGNGAARPLGPLTGDCLDPRSQAM